MFCGMDISTDILRKYCLDDQVNFWGEAEANVSYDYAVVDNAYRTMPKANYYNIVVDDWDKRARSMCVLISECRLENELYVRNLKYGLCIKLQNAGRWDLARMVTSAKWDHEHEKEREENRRKFKEMIGDNLR